MLQPDLWRRGFRFRLHAGYQDPPYGLPERPRDVQPLRLPDHPREMERQGRQWLYGYVAGDRTRRYSDRHQHHLRDRQGVERHASLIEYQLRGRIIPRELHRIGKRYDRVKLADEKDQGGKRRESGRAIKFLRQRTVHEVP